MHFFKKSKVWFYLLVVRFVSWGVGRTAETSNCMTLCSAVKRLHCINYCRLQVSHWMWRFYPPIESFPQSFYLYLQIFVFCNFLLLFLFYSADSSLDSNLSQSITTDHNCIFHSAIELCTKLLCFYDSCYFWALGYSIT